MVEPVGEGGAGRLIDDSFDIQSGNPSGILGRLTLDVVKIGRNRDDGFRYGLAQEIFGVFFQLHQYHGADGLCFVFCTVNAYAPFSAHMAFYRTDRALRICDSLPSCTFSHQSFSFFCKSYDAGRSHAPGGSGDDDRRLIFHNRHTAVCCSQINSDYLSH